MATKPIMAHSVQLFVLVKGKLALGNLVDCKGPEDACRVAEERVSRGRAIGAAAFTHSPGWTSYSGVRGCLYKLECGFVTVAGPVRAWQLRPMPASELQSCEAKIEGTWRPISAAEAAGIFAMAPKRCPSCHGAVVLTGSYAGLARRRFAHRKAHPGCPLDPKRFSGTPSPHPQAIA